MPTIIPSILTINNSASFATLDSFDLKGTTHVIDSFNSRSLATIGRGIAAKPGKRKQGTIVSTTGSATEKPRYFIYTQTSSGDYNLSGSEWTTLSNWSEILTSTGEFTASFVTASNVHGPHGTSSIESSSYALTASYVTNAISASYAETASYVLASNIDQPFGALEATGIFSLPDIPNVSASIAAAVAGGDNLGNHTAVQNLNLANFSIVSASNISSSGYISSSIFKGNLSGSVYGTSSWAVTSSHALTASYVSNAISASYAVTASYVKNAFSASYASSSMSASYAATASYIENALSASYAATASYIENALSASYASTASYVENAISSSFASTASYVSNAVSSSYATTASYVENAISSSFASTASFTVSASYIDISSATQGVITIGDNSVSISKLTNTGTPNFNSISTTTKISASGLLFASLSYDNTIIPSQEGGVVVYDTASGQFYYTGSYVGVLDTTDTASFVTASNVHGPHGINSILSASHAITASYIENALSASYAATASYIENALSASYAATASYVVNSISASYSSTASYVENAISASYALTSSHISAESTTQGEIIIGDTTVSLNNLTDSGTPTFTSLETSTTLTVGTNISASGLLFASLSYDNDVISEPEGGVVVYDTASGQFYYTGSYIGQLSSVETANTASFITASNVYGPYGTSSILSASYAITASYITNAVSSSFASTASYVENAVSSSFASTASYVENAISASYSATSSHIEVTSTTQGVIDIGDTTLNINQLTDTGTPTFNSVSTTTKISASGLLFASLSYDNTSIPEAEGGVVIYDTASGQFYYTGSYIGNIDTANTASFVTASNVHGPQGTNSILSASHAVTASYISTASYALTASYVANAISASYAATASYVVNAISASFATTASHAITASYIETASHALTSSHISLSSNTQGVITVGDTTLSISTLTDTGTPTFNSISTTTKVSASGLLFASLSYDNTTIPEAEGGVVVYDTASGQFYYTGSYIGNIDTANTASFVTSSNVYGPYGANSILSASHAVTASYIENALSASYALTASYVANAISASYASTASFVESAKSASFVTGSKIFGPHGSNSVLSSSNAITSSHIEVSNNNTQGEITIGDTTISLTDLTDTGTPEFTHLKATNYVAADSYLSSSNEIYARSLEVNSITSSYISASNVISSSKYWGLSASYDILTLPNFPNVSASLAALIAGGITDIVQDTTPQLGGNLDLNGSDISGSGNLTFEGNIDNRSYNIKTSDLIVSNSIAVTGSGHEIEGNISFSPISVGKALNIDSTNNRNLIKVGDVDLNNGETLITINDYTKKITLTADKGVTSSPITSSNISASNTTYTKFLKLPQAIGGSSEGSIYFGLSPSDNNGIIYDDGDFLQLGYNDSDKISISSDQVRIQNALYTQGHITSSGNISASGQLSAASVSGFIDTDNDGGILISNNNGTFTTSPNLGFQDGILQVTSKIDLNGDLDVSNHISASSIGDRSNNDNWNIDSDGIAILSGISVTGSSYFTLPAHTGGTEASVVILDSNNQLKTDEVDTRIFGNSLVDKTGTPVNNQLAIWTDSNTLEGEADLTYDNSGNLQLSYSYGANLRLKNAFTSLSEGDPIGAIIFRGRFSGGGDATEPALIEAVSINPNLNTGDKTRAADLRFRVTPSGSKNNNQILRLNADSGSLFSGSVRADRFVTQQDYLRPTASTAQVIGEDTHGSMASGVLRITGSIEADGTWDITLFEVPGSTYGFDSTTIVTLISPDGSTVHRGTTIANAAWISSSTDVETDTNTVLEGYTNVPPSIFGTGDFLNNTLFIQGSSADIVANPNTNFKLTGNASTGNLSFKWNNNSGGGVTELANYNYRILIKYNVYNYE